MHCVCVAFHCSCNTDNKLDSNCTFSCLSIAIGFLAKWLYRWKAHRIHRFWSGSTFIGNISGISPTVIFGNKIQKFFLVTSDVTSDIWTVTSYVTDRSPVGVYVHGRLSCLWRHHCEIIKHKVEHQQKSGNVTGRVLRKQNPRPFGDVTERDLRKQNP